jgi:LuxR family maltose regulon positive regulatory protein
LNGEGGAVAQSPSSAPSVPPLVPRSRLVAKLRESTAPVVLLSAPSGYGKSVLLEQWAEEDPRPFTSIILGDLHNDPGMLVASIVEALARIEPVPDEVSTALRAPEPSIETVVLPRLGRALGERAVPMVLVLDDLERIESPQALAVIAAIAGQLPSGSRLALACRTEPALPIGRLRAHRMLTELGRTELTMTKAECAALLSGLGVELTGKQLDAMILHAEGWPAALYLAGLALTEQPDLDAAISRFAGDDRIVVDYIKEEFLASVSQRRLEFMRRAAVLDRLSGDLCDAVLGRSGSARTLVDLARSNSLLTPLDRRDEWFRFHPMFREMLCSELHRVEPGKAAELNLRASEWWAGQGDWDRAIQHAIEAGDPARAGELLWLAVPRYMARGRVATVIGWLGLLGEETIASDPALSLTAAFGWITRGAGSQAEHWIAVARSLLQAGEDAGKGLDLGPGLALAEAGLARQGVAAMCASTEVAAKDLADESPWLSMCCMLDGVGLHLRGLRDRAQERLVEGARRGSVSAPTIQVLALAQLALLAIEDEDWRLAESLASQARAQVNRSGLIEYPMVALAMAVSALVESRFGRVDKAVADMRIGTGLLGQLDEFAPWYEVEARIALARCASRLGDGPAAEGFLAEARKLLKRTPDALALEEWIEQSARAIEELSVADVSGLSPAELRVLQFLPGHLSYPRSQPRPSSRRTRSSPRRRASTASSAPPRGGRRSRWRRRPACSTARPIRRAFPRPSSDLDDHPLRAMRSRRPGPRLGQLLRCGQLHRCQS